MQIPLSKCSRAHALSETAAYAEATAAGAVLSRAEIEGAARTLPAHEVRRLSVALSDKDAQGMAALAAEAVTANQGELFTLKPNRRTQGRLEDFGLLRTGERHLMGRDTQPPGLTGKGRAYGVLLAALLAGRGPEVVEALS